jgi:MinD-like ATPase involved in chromosome partitioning or flagellar assembly/ActR/RegA family two-component response regulator
MEDELMKVLLIEDNPGDARLIREMLAEERGAPFDLEHADRLSTGLGRLAAGGIDVVLLDLSLPDSRGLSTFVRVHAQAPEVPIVLLTGRDDEELAVEAMREGAQDYLVKGQVDSSLLVRSMRYAIERHRAQAKQLRKAQPVKAGKVLGFIGAKGGVGTTTVALNVASILAQQKKAVIAVELRPDYGTFSLQLDGAPVENLRNLLELGPELINERELSTRLFSSRFGLKVLFGPQKVDEFREIEPDQAEAVIKGLTGMADCVIIDLPRHLSSANQVAIRHCDFIALVVVPEPTCVMSGKVTLELLRSWGMSGGLVGSVVVNRTLLAKAMKLREIKSRLGCEIVGVVPPAAEACMAAQERGVPLALHQPHSTAAVNLTEIANRLAAGEVMVVRL